MALQGTLKDFGLADIFQLIAIQRKTGVLVLRRDGDEVRVCFLKGLVASADSSARRLEHRIGTLLVKTGRISASQLDDALRIQATTLRKLGHILLDEKMITDVDLRDVLQIQTTQLIFRLFRWRDGTYEFSQEESIDYDREHFTPIGAETLLMEGARMIDEWPIIERKIPNFEVVFRKSHQAVAVLATGQSAPQGERMLKAGPAGTQSTVAVEAPPFSNDEGIVLSLLDGRATVEDVIDRSLMSEFEACHILYDLLNRGLIETVGAPASSSAVEPARLPRIRPAVLAGFAIPVVSFMILLTAPWSPVAPNKSGFGFPAEAIARADSRSRLTRIDLALRTFYLEEQSLPTRLESLVQAGLLSPRDLVDPWSRAYAYRLESGRYELAGTGPDGELDPVLVVVNAFHPLQRAVLEGMAVEEGPGVK